MDMLLVSVQNANIKKTISGVSISARAQHYSDLLKNTQLSWLEILADNYLSSGSSAYKKLEKIAKIYPLVFHCVGFNLGSPDPVNKEYLQKIKNLIKIFKPKWVSDHLCFCGQGNLHSPDLLPIVYNKKTLKQIAKKINYISEELNIDFLIENVSVYLKYKKSEMTEEEFINQLVQESSCKILLDVNNLYVNSQNYNFDPLKAFLKLPVDKIKQIHLAGYSDYGTHIIDTHSQSIQKPVLLFLKQIIKYIKNVPATIERDDNIPPLKKMLEEVALVKKIYSA